MSAPNPYSSPPALQDEATNNDELQTLSRMRPAVRLALVSLILFTIGAGLSSLTGFFTAMQMRGGGFARTSPFLVIRSVQLLILMVVMGYTSNLVWRLLRSIHDTLRSSQRDLREVLELHKSCWYAIGGLGILYVVLNISASALMALLNYM